MQDADECVSDHDFVPLPPCKNDSATAFYLLISESLFFPYLPGARKHLHVRLDTDEWYRSSFAVSALIVRATTVMGHGGVVHRLIISRVQYPYGHKS